MYNRLTTLQSFLFPVLSCLSLSVGLHLAEILELQHLDVAGLVELDDALLAVDGEERARLLPVLPDDDLDLGDHSNMTSALVVGGRYTQYVEYGTPCNF